MPTRATQREPDSRMSREVFTAGEIRLDPPGIIIPVEACYEE